MSNLAQRLMVAAAGIPVLLFATVRGGPVLIVVAIAIQAVCLWEWRSLSAGIGAHVNVVGIVLVMLSLDYFVMAHGSGISISISLTAICLTFLMEVFRGDHQPVKNLGAMALFAGYVVLPIAIWTILKDLPFAFRWQPAGPLAVLFVATWVVDTAAYFGGRQFGRHKLHVAASPNKTVEGFVAGAVIACSILPLAKILKLASPAMADYVALPLIVGIAGQLGDLLESLMKREIQIKDTSAILPGHGGFLDRFDSLFISSLLLFAYLNLSPA